MKRSVPLRVFLCLAAINAVVWMSGATWNIQSPNYGDDFSQNNAIPGEGAALANATVTVKVMSNGTGITYQSATTTASPPLHPMTDQGSWAASLSPPLDAPYNGQWPVGWARYDLFDGPISRDITAIEIFLGD